MRDEVAQKHEFKDVSRKVVVKEECSVIEEVGEVVGGVDRQENPVSLDIFLKL